MKPNKKLRSRKFVRDLLWKMKLKRLPDYEYYQVTVVAMLDETGSMRTTVEKRPDPNPLPSTSSSSKNEQVKSYKDSKLKNAERSWLDLDVNSDDDDDDDDDDEGIKNPNIRTGFHDVWEPTKGINVDRTNPLCPNFVLDKAEKERLQKPFKRTLIVKLQGCELKVDQMIQALNQIWAKNGEIRVNDLVNNFLIVKFQNQDDHDMALTGGPWMVLNSYYLCVMRWRPDFNPRTEVIDRVTVWVRLHDLPVTHYDKKFLLNLGDVIGKAIKIDDATALREGGKFARLCVELDLKRPLLHEYSVEGEVKTIEYEFMNFLCLYCGRFGHVREACSDFIAEKNLNANSPAG